MSNSSESLHEMAIEKEEFDTDTILEYQKLNDKCDKVINKIKNRKSKIKKKQK